MPTDEIDDEWIQLCKDELEAIAKASQQLIYDALATDWLKVDAERPEEVRQAEMDRRRAELYKEHLDAAGIEIRRTGSRCDHLCCGDRCTKKLAHEGDHAYEEI